MKRITRIRTRCLRYLSVLSVSSVVITPIEAFHEQRPQPAKTGGDEPDRAPATSGASAAPDQPAPGGDCPACGGGYASAPILQRVLAAVVFCRAGLRVSDLDSDAAGQFVVAMS